MEVSKKTLSKAVKLIKETNKPNNNSNKKAGNQSVAAGYGKRQETKSPKINYKGIDSVRVVHSELLYDLSQVSGDLFSNLGITIQPGLQGSFPWLSSLAALYETYKFHSLSYEYVTRVGTTTSGSIMLGCDYDSNDNIANNEQILSQYQGTVEDAIWKDIKWHANITSMNQGMRKYVRVAPLVGVTDIKTYDVGLFQAAVVSSSVSTSTVGKLWVHYDIELFTPQFKAIASSLLSAYIPLVGDYVAGPLFGGQMSWDNNNSTTRTGDIFGYIVSTSGGALQFQGLVNSLYQLTLSWIVNSAVSTLPVLATTLGSLAGIWSFTPVSSGQVRAVFTGIWDLTQNINGITITSIVGSIPAAWSVATFAFNFYSMFKVAQKGSLYDTSSTSEFAGAVPPDLTNGSLFLANDGGILQKPIKPARSIFKYNCSTQKLKLFATSSNPTYKIRKQNLEDHTVPLSIMNLMKRKVLPISGDLEDDEAQEAIKALVDLKKKKRSD